MEIRWLNHETATVELSRDELGTLGNALNEVLHGLDIWDFPIRMGVERSEAEQLLQEISDLFKRMKAK